jgi:pimeloyl-ACP methyl ester carboxylesterase
VEDYATARLVDDVLAVADAKEMERIDLVGHDWGGLLAWLVASRHAERVRTLAVVSTPHPRALERMVTGDDADAMARRKAMEAFRASAGAERLLLGPDASGSGLATLLTETGLDDEDATSYVATLTEPGALGAALNWFRAMDATVLDGLGPVEVPTLYVWSTGDDSVSRRAAEETAEFVRGPYSFEVLENVSHWVPEMAPVELSALLLAHLRAH